MSTGDDNDELVDNLVDADYIKSAKTEHIFRAVDRADYFLPEHRDSAYKDLAWKHGHLHLSAPCIYSEVLESLELEEGMSFLNLGSGTGYLSTMAGLIIGVYGENHGVEVHEDVVEYARAKLDEFKQKTPAFEEFDFAEPQFVVGNCLQLSSACRLYDRVYCGAACPPEHENYMRNLIKIGGILVMPLNDQLLQVRRVSETDWSSKSVLPVSFATLITPTKDKADVVDLPDCHVLTLQEICRHNIRGIIKRRIIEQFPSIITPARKTRPPKAQNKRSVVRRGRLVNLIPMQMGMMYLDNLDISNDEIDDDDDDENPHHRRHRMADSFECSDSDCSFYGELNHHEPSPELVSNHKKAEEENEREDEARELKLSTNNNNCQKGADLVNGLHAEAPNPEDIVFGTSQQNHKNYCRPSTSNTCNNTDNKRSSPESRRSESECEDNNNASKRMRCSDSEDEEESEKPVKGNTTEDSGKEDSGPVKEDKNEEERDHSVQEATAELANSANSAPILIGLRCGNRMRQRDRSSDDSDLDHMELDHGSVEAGEEAERAVGVRDFHMPATPSAVLNAFNLLSLPRKFRCSSSTSADTSGFGSFGDESLDLPVLAGNCPMAESRNGDSHGSRGNKNQGESMKECDDEEAECSGDGVEGPTLGQLMKKHIQKLPLPVALRSYLAYYRK